MSPFVKHTNNTQNKDSGMWQEIKMNYTLCALCIVYRHSHHNQNKLIGNKITNEK